MPFNLLGVAWGPPAAPPTKLIGGSLSTYTPLHLVLFRQEIQENFEAGGVEMSRSFHPSEGVLKELFKIA